MMIRRTTFALAGLMAGAGIAGAAPATPEEAQRITALLERYVGHPWGQQSAVSVVPHGEGYTASLDLSQTLSFLATNGVSMSAGALAMDLTPQSGGRWRVTINGLPPFGVAEGDHAFSVVSDGYTLDGLFDPAIRWFSTASATTSGSSTRTTGKQGPVDEKVTESSSSTMQAQDAGGDTIDFKSTSTQKDIAYAMTAPSTPPGVAPSGMTFRATAASLDTAISMAHQPMAAMQDLWQFLVAHTSKNELIADQTELKTRLKAIIPLSTATLVDLKLSKLSVETRLGTFGLDSFAEHCGDAGPEAKEGVFTRIAMAGLQLPSGLVPGWATPLLPTSIDVAQSYGPLDLKPALLMAIDDFDLAAAKPLTDAQRAEIAALFSQGDKVLTFAPSTITTALMTLKFEGEARLTKPLPSGSATVSATGLDKTIEALRAASPNDPNAAQAIAVLMAAKATGKAEGPDSYSWRIEAPAGATPTVNGMPLGGGPAARLKAPRPQKL